MLSSSVQKHKPVYKLHVTYEAPSGKKWDDKTIEAPFYRWFSADGFIQLPHLKKWLASEIQVLGLADSQSATSAQDRDIGETVVVSNPGESGSTATPQSTRSRKGKKKA